MCTILMARNILTPYTLASHPIIQHSGYVMCVHSSVLIVFYNSMILMALTCECEKMYRVASQLSRY